MLVIIVAVWVVVSYQRMMLGSTHNAKKLLVPPSGERERRDGSDQPNGPDDVSKNSTAIPIVSIAKAYWWNGWHEKTAEETDDPASRVMQQVHSRYVSGVIDR